MVCGAVRSKACARLLIHTGPELAENAVEVGRIHIKWQEEELPVRRLWLVDDIGLWRAQGLGSASSCRGMMEISDRAIFA